MVKRRLGSTLYLMVPEKWQENGQPGPMPWAVYNGKDKPVETGSSIDISSLPKATSYEAIAPASVTLFTNVELPEKNRRRFMRALPNAIEGKIFSDPEDVYVTHGPKSADNELPVAILEKQWLDSMNQRFREAGIKLDAIRPESLVLPVGDGEWSVFWDGVSGFVRTGKYSAMTLDTGGDPPGALEILADESSKISASPKSICVYYPNGVKPPRVDKWEEKLGLPIKIKKSWSWEEFVKDESESSINFMDVVAPDKDESKSKGRQFATTAILLLALGAVWVGSLLLGWWQVRSEADMLTAKINAGFMETFPNAALVDAPYQMKINLNKLRDRAGVGGAKGLIPLLEEINPALPAGVSFHSLRYNRGSLNLGILLKSDADIARIQNYFKQKQIPVSIKKVAGLHNKLVGVSISVGSRKAQ